MQIYDRNGWPAESDRRRRETLDDLSLSLSQREKGDPRGAKRALLEEEWSGGWKFTGFGAPGGDRRLY